MDGAQLVNAIRLTMECRPHVSKDVETKLRSGGSDVSVPQGIGDTTLIVRPPGVVRIIWGRPSIIIILINQLTEASMWGPNNPYNYCPPPYQPFDPNYGGGWGKNPLKKIRKTKAWLETMEKEYKSKSKDKDDDRKKPGSLSRLELWIFTVFFLSPIVGLTTLFIGSYIIRASFENLQPVFR